MTITIPLGQPVPEGSKLGYQKQLEGYRGVKSVVITDNIIAVNMPITDCNEDYVSLVHDMVSIEHYHRSTTVMQRDREEHNKYMVNNADGSTSYIILNKGKDCIKFVDKWGLEQRPRANVCEWCMMAGIPFTFDDYVFNDNTTPYLH